LVAESSDNLVATLLFSKLMPKFVDLNGSAPANKIEVQWLSMKGNNDVIELLVTKGRAKVDQVDTAGNTALLCAAKVGNVSTMNVLVDHGASIDAQNKIGETVWHYAVRQDDDTLLKAVAGLYRKAKKIDRGTKIISFAEGRNPLQV
jgi:alanine-alpha-ketoisovalerate/valine-pyruvate aminotransferase